MFAIDSNIMTTLQVQFSESAVNLAPYPHKDSYINNLEENNYNSILRIFRPYVRRKVNYIFNYKIFHYKKPKNHLQKLSR